MKWFKRLRLRQKMLCGFLLLALIGVAIGCAGFYGVRNVKGALDEIALRRLAISEILYRIMEGQATVIDGARGLSNPLFDAQSRATAYSRIENGKRYAQKAIDSHAQDLKTPKHDELFQAFIEDWSLWLENIQWLVDIAKATDGLVESGAPKNDPEITGYYEDCAKLYVQKILPLQLHMETSLSAITEYNNEMVEKAREEADVASRTSSILLGSTVSAAAVLCYLFGTILSAYIRKPIYALVDVAGKMAKGEIDIKTPQAPRDEIGDLIRAFQKVIDATKKQMKVLGDVALGDLDIDIDPEDYGAMGHSLKIMVDSMKDQLAVAKHLGEGDLTVEIEPRSEKDILVIGLKDLIENLNTVVEEISEATEQMAAASEQIGQGAQGIAQGVSEQANSIEEVSNGLEEMAGMTKLNADNAMKAKTLSQNVRNSAQKSSRSIEKMNEAMGQIKSASDETARIVKTIDDIAFQTNLLALNAAVEAARAGEAGRGFAVVASEVRNLALKSAQAAKETADMIETSLRRSDEGVKIAYEVHGALADITAGIVDTNNLLTEIASSSQTQAKGIEKLFLAAENINRATQENAATAEESASSAQELAAQAQDIRKSLSWFTAKQHLKKL